MGWRWASVLHDLRGRRKTESSMGWLASMVAYSVGMMPAMGIGPLAVGDLDGADSLLVGEAEGDGDGAAEGGFDGGLDGQGHGGLGVEEHRGLFAAAGDADDEGVAVVPRGGLPVTATVLSLCESAGPGQGALEQAAARCSG